MLFNYYVTGAPIYKSKSFCVTESL
jgi:hypothetical protein